MAEDPLGALRMKNDIQDADPVLPMIPVKPNNAIPATIAVLLLLGSLFMLYSAYSNLSADPPSSAELEEMAEQFNAAGANTSGAELEQFFQELDDAGYFTTLGLIEVVASLTLWGGSILFFLRDRRGVWVGAAGGTLVMVDAIYGLITMLGLSEGYDPLISTTFKVTAGLGLGCGIICIALPFIPLLFAAGRAALHKPVSLVTEAE